MKWNLDTTHSAVDFSVRHLMISTVKGRFKTFTGSGETTDDGTLKSVEMSIDVTSIDTNVVDRDNHLRSADFFDVEKFPTMTFKSTKISQQGTDLEITGDLPIHGVTKPLTLTGELVRPMTDPWGNSRAALTVATKINRKDWGLGWNMALEAGGFVVGDEIKLSIEVEAVAAEKGTPVAA
jgi:polyisoprenoid-binding protein YceI